MPAKMTSTIGCLQQEENQGQEHEEKGENWVLKFGNFRAEFEHIIKPSIYVFCVNKIHLHTISLAVITINHT